MFENKITKNVTVLLAVLMIISSPAFAQKIVKSSVQKAGFSFSTDSVTTTEPVIHYQQDIQMLSSYTDKPSLSIFGDGRALVHYPVYMKKAGDYEMMLDVAELEDLIQQLSSDGIMDFDEKRVKERVKKNKKSLLEKGELVIISDAVVTSVEIKLDTYQKNIASTKRTNFYKRFKWKNLEHDTKHIKQTGELTKANNSIVKLKKIMTDSRLTKRNQ